MPVFALQKVRKVQIYKILIKKRKINSHPLPLARIKNDTKS
jgi:hypothetical protein